MINHKELIRTEEFLRRNLIIPRLSEFYEYYSEPFDDKETFFREIKATNYVVEENREEFVVIDKNYNSEDIKALVARKRKWEEEVRASFKLLNRKFPANIVLCAIFSVYKQHSKIFLIGSPKNKEYVMWKTRRLTKSINGNFQCQFISERSEIDFSEDGLLSITLARAIYGDSKISSELIGVCYPKIVSRFPNISVDLLGGIRVRSSFEIKYMPRFWHILISKAASIITQG